MAYRKIPFLLPMLPTELPVMQRLYKKAKELEARPGILCVRFSHGFFAADIEEMGMAVMVICDNDYELAESIADIMAEEIQNSKTELKIAYPTLDEALECVNDEHKGPLVLADASDNPGAGGMGDSTHILRTILERKITGVGIATIVDPVSVQKCIEAGEGATVELQLGGHSDPAYSGGPVKVRAKVEMLSDGIYTFKCRVSRGALAKHGNTALLDINGNKVLVTSIPRQPYDLEIFRRHGVDPEKLKILVVKSTVHFRDSYSTISDKLITLALPGYAVPIPSHYTYKNWKGEV